MKKKLRGIQRSADRHWVGDGFPVRTLFAYPNRASVLSPFLLLDYAGRPSSRRRPAARRRPAPAPRLRDRDDRLLREVEHRDSSGGGGRIGEGDVQWMTAASGIVHEEFHGREYAKRGGPFEMVQLWVNLPARTRRLRPATRRSRAASIPTVPLADGAGSARVIAGELGGVKGPARTFTPMQVGRPQLHGPKRVELDVPDGWTTASSYCAARCAWTGRRRSRTPRSASSTGPAAGSRSTRRARRAALLLAGEPIHEPIVGMGPFVMNSPGEIRQAMVDFESGRMGKL